MLKITWSTIIMLILLVQVKTSGLPEVTLEIAIAFLIGLSVRLTFNFSKGALTFKDAFARVVYACCLSYLLMFAWRDFEIQKNIIYSIAGIGVVSAEIVNEAVKLMQLGLKAYMRSWLNNITAKNDSV